MTLHVYADMEQRSEEWYAARCGIVTASAVSTLIKISPPEPFAVACPLCKVTPGEQCMSVAKKTPTPIKTFHGERTEAASVLPPVYSPATGDTARSLINLLASERITGVVEETFTSRDMERGIFAEPYARELYGEHHAPAVEAGFMVREFDGFKIGYSPDGLVDNDGLIEIKAPRAKNQIGQVIAGEVPVEYMAQCQTGLLVSGRAWCDYVPYVGGMPLWVKRIEPDPDWQGAILGAAERAERLIAETVAAYQEAVEGLPQTERIDFFEDVGLVF